MERRSSSKFLSRLSLRTAFAALACLALALFACSCQYFVQDEMDRNKSNLAKLRVGMDKAEVKEIMGEPLIKEVYDTPDVWYYYVQPRWQDGAATRDECAPVVFDEDGRLAGWGKEYYKANCEFNMWPGAQSKTSMK
jgi:outer membrane protein assembly factor BamE (lipoprotein component of BamABCDE complex)